ncbi:MAG: IS1595 family transposase [Rhodomicrobium sp.]
MANSVLNAPHFQIEEAAFAYVEAALWPNGPVCPHCGNTDATRIGRLQGKTTRPGLRKCYACKKPFTVRIGTIFESSHLSLHLWLQIIHLMCASKKGLATRQIQRMLECSMKTAWFLGHRIRESMADLPGSITGGALGGKNQVVEVDESYIGGKAKNRAFREPAPKKAIVSLVEREGRVRSFHVQAVTGQTLKPIIQANMDKNSYLMTDDSAVYPAIARQVADGHGTVNHSANEYVRAYFWHTNSCENYFSILKRGIIGVYHHVSEAHLHRYLAEFDFRHNNRIKLGIDDKRRAENTVKGAKGKRLTYETASLKAQA